MSYRTLKTNRRVENLEPDLVTRLRWRANRRCKNLNEKLDVPFYRWEVRPNKDKWEVVAMQNVAEPF